MSSPIKPKRKKFFLRPEQIRPLAEGYGLCFATDLITVNGQSVGYMYREEPDYGNDSGWRFFSGQESQEYTHNPDNLALYDVNIIANYDPTIVPLLDAPCGSAFERCEHGHFVEVELELDSDSDSESESESEPDPGRTIH